MSLDRSIRRHCRAPVSCRRLDGFALTSFPGARNLSRSSVPNTYRGSAVVPAKERTFPTKASKGGRVTLESLGQKLERDVPFELGILRKEHFTHAALADWLENSVTHGANTTSWASLSEWPAICRSDSILVGVRWWARVLDWLNPSRAITGSRARILTGRARPDFRRIVANRLFHTETMRRNTNRENLGRSTQRHP